MSNSKCYSIRYALSSDLVNMAELLKQLFSIEADFEVDLATQLSGLKLLLKSENGQIFVVEDINREVVAMATLQKVVSTAEGGVVAWVEDIIVDESHRGQGIGNSLLTHIQKWAEAGEIKRLQLVADRDNKPALSFYSQHNWIKTNLVVLRQK
ncbi:MAG: GNAT family N-acetyltransferase [Candidatus Thiodiazotropha sp. DIVDIV]